MEMRLEKRFMHTSSLFRGEKTLPSQKIISIIRCGSLYPIWAMPESITVVFAGRGTSLLTSKASAKNTVLKPKD